MADATVDDAMAIEEPAPFALMELLFPDAALVISRYGEVPAAVEVRSGRGLLTVLASPFGVPEESAAPLPVKSEVDDHLPNPYPLLGHVRTILDNAMKRQTLFEVDPELSLIACRRKPGEYVLGVCNNSLSPQPFALQSHIGPIVSLRETEIDCSERKAVGYLPEGFEDADLGVSGDDTIAGGDVRIFVVTVDERDVEEVPHRKPPARPKGRILSLRGQLPIKEQVLSRPTFFEHFDGVMVDWKVLAERDRHSLERETGWIGRQGLRVFVDLSSGINLYPDLRLVNNIQEEYERSMHTVAAVLSRMPMVGSKDLLICLHRLVENNIGVEDTWASIDETIRGICADAAGAGISVHLRLAPGKPVSDIDDAVGFLARIGASNLSLAPSTGNLIATRVKPDDVRELLSDRVGLWLAGAPQRDLGGATWTVQAPLHAGCDEERLGAFLSIAPNIPVVLDAEYVNTDDEYLDTVILQRVLTDL